VEKVLTVIERRIRRRYARRGRVGAVDPALAARAFNGMILASMLGRRIFKEPVISRTPVDRLARTLVRIFLRGIGPAKGGA